MRMQVGRGNPLMLIKYCFLFLLGITAGFFIAAGMVAFITIVGVLTRLAIRTDTAKRIMLYEDIVVVGTCLGNIYYIYNLDIPIGILGLIIFGFFSGCFVGCLAIALEEVIQVFPIMASKINLRQGIPVIVLCLALGKAIGAFYQLYVHFK